MKIIYCSYCGKKMEIKTGNFDSWFCISWCCEEHKKPPVEHKYNMITGKKNFARIKRP